MNIAENLKQLFSLENKSVIFTGAAGGIGSAVAEGLALAGAEVALCDINLERLKKVQEKIEAAGGKATIHQLDVTDLDNIKTCVKEIADHYGHIDILVNCAGVNRREGLADVDEKTYDKMMSINLKGVFFMSQTVAYYMKEQKKGSIINIGSHNTGSILGGCSVYGATEMRRTVADQIHGRGVGEIQYPCKLCEPGPYTDGTYSSDMGKPGKGKISSGPDRP